MPRSQIAAPGELAAPYAQNTLQWAMFNATVSLLGLPGLASSVDGLTDEGLGFHADGTTRRMGEGDEATGVSGQRAASYIRYGLIARQPWLYDNIMGGTYDAGGNFRVTGSAYSGARRSYGQTLNPGDALFNSVLQRGLSAGMGFANSAVESSILGLMGKDSPYGNGKAHLNFYLNLDHKGALRLQGEGDVLWPLYDSPHTTVYTQLGLRSMYGGGGDYGSDRWIGNMGLGQRWFPGASVSEDGKTVDSGKWMLGYNTFFDYDISRGHQRGGLGLEAQYDWLKLAANYYAPLTGWKNSRDFDGRYVEERAAHGWDARVKGYLPFYRQIALTGAYTQWYGENVGMFGPSQLEKDPKIWSYGLEYTPVPAMTAFVNQRQTSRGRTDTEFGLRFTYHFGMDAKSQFKPSRVAEMRTVHGARHDFVDRENKIVLEYRDKENYRVEYLGLAGTNRFLFRVLSGFGKGAAGQTVRVTASSGVFVAMAQPAVQPDITSRVLAFMDNFVSVRTAHAASSMSYTSNAKGEFIVALDNVIQTPVTLTIMAGNATSSVTLHEAVVKGELTAAKYDFINGETTTLTFDGKDATAGQAITWTVTGPGQLSAQQNIADAEGKATATLTANAIGKGDITVTATVNGREYTCTVILGENPVLTLAVSGGSFSSNSATATVTATATLNGSPVTIGPSDITWTVESSAITAAWWDRSGGALNGLTWGNTAEEGAVQEAERTTMTGTAPTGGTAQLTDIVGSRTVTIKAVATIDEVAYPEATISVTFNAGPMARFKGKPLGYAQWADAYPLADATRLPAAELCLGSGNIPSEFQSWGIRQADEDRSTDTGLPTRAELQAVFSGDVGKGAASAAGWPYGGYWTGELNDKDYAYQVFIDDGLFFPLDIDNDLVLLVCRQQP